MLEARFQRRILLCLIMGFLLTSLVLIRLGFRAFLPVISFRGIPFTVSFLQLILIGILTSFLLHVSLDRIILTRNLMIAKSSNEVLEMCRSNIKIRLVI
jgi:hypothetical protein